MKSPAATHLRKLQVMVHFREETWARGKLPRFPQLAHDLLEHVTLFPLKSTRALGHVRVCFTTAT